MESVSGFYWKIFFCWGCERKKERRKEKMKKEKAHVVKRMTY
jgi:hypothetical protein